MNITRLGAIAKKEFLQVLRDPRSLMIALLMPLVQMLMLGYGVSLDIKHVPLCTWDREASQQSENLIKSFSASQYFEIVKIWELPAAHPRHRCRRLPHRHRHTAGLFLATERQWRGFGAGHCRCHRRQ